MSRIVTFYSYKGGVGRTLALANMGVLLARGGKKVLLMDWDLEAPGLDSYFLHYVKNGFPPDKGTVHLLHQAKINGNLDWKSHVTEVLVARVNAPQPEALTLSIMPSGAPAHDYAQKVRKFSWIDFVENGDGGPILEQWRNEWKKEYDFVLIDSRTGITDSGGICTILLPDFLVLVFTANDQSFGGALGILSSIQEGRRNLAVPRPPLMVLPLLSKFDRRDEVTESDKWMDRFARDLKPIYDEWLPKAFVPMQILELTKVPYITRFSFGEPLPVLSHSLTDPDLPGFYFENAARLIRTDFREAAQIIDPNIPSPGGIDSDVTAVLQRIPIDESKLLLLLRDGEKMFGESPRLASLLTRVGVALYEHARFSTAEPLMRRALAIDEAHYGSEHPDVATGLNNLALLLKDTNRLGEAESLMRRALAIDEAHYGQEHPEVATDLNNLAQLLRDTNRLEEAEPLMRRALAIDEAHYGSEHPDVATGLNNLALLLKDTNRLGEAESLMRRALAIDEAHYGSEHPDVATDLNNLGGLLREVARLEEAEPLMRRALAIDEASYGPEHPSVALRLNNLAGLLVETDRLEEAEPLIRRALAIDEASYGPEHPKVALRLNNLGGLLREAARLEEAEPLIRRALAIDEASYGPEHPKVVPRLNNLGQLLRAMDRFEEAEVLLRRALAIDEASYGPEHPKVVPRLNNLGQLLRATDRFEEAEVLLRRALAIDEASYGPEHPLVAVRLNSLAGLLRKVDRLAEAEVLLRRALAIDEASYGPEHPKVVPRLNNLGQLLRAMDRLEEAEVLLRQALLVLLIFYRTTGNYHPFLKNGFRNLKSLMDAMRMDETISSQRFDEIRDKVGIEDDNFRRMVSLFLR